MSLLILLGVVVAVAIIVTIALEITRPKTQEEINYDIENPRVKF